MYDYPQLFSLDSIGLRRVVVVGICVALLAGVSARVLQLKSGATAWLLAFAANATLGAALVAWDVPPVLTFWMDFKRWGLMAVVLITLWLLIILSMAATQDQVTLVESVVVMTMLVGVFWFQTPSCGLTREGSRQSQCSNNLKSIGIAIHNDVEQSGGDLIGAVVQPGEDPPRSWRVELLPYLDQERLRKRYDDRETWNAPANKVVARASQHPFVCPNNATPTDKHKLSYTAYLACTGSNAFFPIPANGDVRGRRFADIRDGTSHTAMVVEACGQNVVWTEPRDFDVDRVSLGVNLPGFLRGESSGLLSSHDPGRVGILMGDGSVRRVSADVAPSVLKAMLTIDGGEPATFD